MENTNHFDAHGQQPPPDRTAGILADPFTRMQVNKISRDLEKEMRELAKVDEKRTRGNNTYLELATIYGAPMVSESGGVPRPERFAEHERLHSGFLGAEIASLLANLVLLTFLTFSYMSIPWQAKIAVIAGLFAVIWQVVPAILETRFNIKTTEPESIRPIRQVLLVGGVFAFGGLAAFYVGRASDETEGMVSMLYNNSLTLAEIGFGICAACFAILRRFYSWSMTHTARYDKLTARADKLRASIATLRERLAAYAPTTPSNGGAEHVN